MVGIVSKYKQIIQNRETKKAEALFRLMGFPYYNGNQPIIISQPYNGEKTAGELGAIKNYVPDIQSLSARSWQAYTESELAQMIIHNYLLWVVGGGLKFKAEPQNKIIGSNFDSNSFIEYTETRFNLFLNSKRSTNTRSATFHQLVYQAKKQAIIAGDCLVILDYGRPESKNKNVSARLMDGFYLRTPVVDKEPTTGNFISNGVEINNYGEPVAYHVLLDDMSYQRIEAYTKTGTLQAFLVFGLQYRVDFYRGLPLLSAVLETMKKLDRYKEASVAGAEERAKIPYSVEHNVNSTGEDPFSKIKSAMGHGIDPGTEKITNDLLAKTASNLRYTTNKTVVNMPIGATLKAPFNGGTESSFKEFYETNFDVLCSTIGIPPEVAMNKYTTSFSSSRGANKNWEHKVLFDRGNLEKETYQPFYNYWLEMEIFTGKISAKKYLIAKQTDDFMVVEAFQKARFIGSKMPFIDPLKEVQAVRAKLGDDNTPLCTKEQATEELNGGNWETNIVQSAKENEIAKNLGFNLNENDGNTSI